MWILTLHFGRSMGPGPGAAIVRHIGNDEYFREDVFTGTVTSTKCDALAAYRRVVPTLPLVHSKGGLGVSSR